MFKPLLLINNNITIHKTGAHERRSQNPMFAGKL
jgi:hypothetical protein